MYLISIQLDLEVPSETLLVKIHKFLLDVENEVESRNWHVRSLKLDRTIVEEKEE